MPRKRIWSSKSQTKTKTKKKLAIYRAWPRISNCWEWDPNSGLSGLESSALTTRPRRQGANLRRDATSHVLFLNQSVLADFDDRKKKDSHFKTRSLSGTSNKDNFCLQDYQLGRVLKYLRTWDDYSDGKPSNGEVGKCKDETSTNLVDGAGGDEKTTQSTGRTSRQFSANGVDTTSAAKTKLCWIWITVDGQELYIGQRILHEVSIFKGWNFCAGKQQPGDWCTHMINFRALMNWQIAKKAQGRKTIPLIPNWADDFYLPLSIRHFRHQYPPDHIERNEEFG